MERSISSEANNNSAHVNSTLVHSETVISLLCLILASIFSPAKTHHPMLITLSMNLKSFSFSHPPPNSKCHLPYHGKNVIISISMHNLGIALIPVLLSFCSLQPSTSRFLVPAQISTSGLFMSVTLKSDNF